jgi:hypothetical protein
VLLCFKFVAEKEVILVAEKEGARRVCRPCCTCASITAMCSFLGWVAKLLPSVCVACALSVMSVVLCLALGTVYYYCWVVWLVLKWCWLPWLSGRLV